MRGVSWTEFFIRCLVQGIAFEVGRNIIRNMQKK